MTSVVSRIGTARMSSGSSSVTTVVPATRSVAARPHAASAKPSTWLPESPMKTFAPPLRLRLNGRNARHAASSASATTSTARFGWSVAASMAKKSEAIAASDAASPSMLSSMLNAFVIPTSQNTASTSASQWFDTIVTLSPAARTTAAAASCAPIFASGGRLNMSSSSPATKRIAQPPRIPSTCAFELGTGSSGPGTAPRATATRTPTTSPAKIPIPPIVGVVCRCQRSSRGAETTRRAAGERRRPTRTRAAAGSARMDAAALTRGRLTSASRVRRSCLRYGQRRLPEQPP